MENIIEGPLFLLEWNDNEILNNHITNGGISLGNSKLNNIQYNIINNSILTHPYIDPIFFDIGISIWGWDYLPISESNSIFGNTFINNGYGILVSSSAENNRIYRNNFFNNQVHAYDMGSPDREYPTCWDYQGFGNYWSDYREKYPTASPEDYCWDTPYIINPYANYDHFPLLTPWDQNVHVVSPNGGEVFRHDPLTCSKCGYWFMVVISKM